MAVAVVGQKAGTLFRSRLSRLHLQPPVHLDILWYLSVCGVTWTTKVKVRKQGVWKWFRVAWSGLKA